MESGGRENITEILNTFITITSLISNMGTCQTEQVAARKIVSS